jgi:hypothetical protein
LPGFAALPWIVLAAASAPRGPAGAQCPSDDELRRSLGVEGKNWRVACNATKKEGVQVAALLPPTTPTGAARVVASVVKNERRVRSEIFLDGLEGEALAKTRGEDWQISFRPAGIPAYDPVVPGSRSRRR